MHRVAVAGASGFAGALAAYLVQRHPRLELTTVTARADAGRRLDALYPRYRVHKELEELDPDALAERAEAALVAYPHGAAAPVVQALRERGLPVVDLSADFRLDRERYERYYQAHEAPALIDEAVYGLTELHRDDIREASGTTHFVSVDENVNPYGVEGHRHRAELERELGNGFPVTFTPHLVPLDQGLLASCYVTPERGVTPEEVRELFRSAYDGEPFIELADEPPGVRDVRDTNICRIHATVEPATGRVLVFAAIDNLWKGAAGQAIQDLNLMLGLDETEGLA